MITPETPALGQVAITLGQNGEMKCETTLNPLLTFGLLEMAKLHWAGELRKPQEGPKIIPVTPAIPNLRG